MTKRKVTPQRFYTIKAQLKGGNDLDKIAAVHGLKPGTVRAIRGCRTYGVYLSRSSGYYAAKKLDAVVSKPKNQLPTNRAAPVRITWLAQLTLGWRAKKTK